MRGWSEKNELNMISVSDLSLNPSKTKLKPHEQDFQWCLTFHVVVTTGVLISPEPDQTEKTIERSSFFVRHGGHCCRGDLVGRTTF